MPFIRHVLQSNTWQLSCPRCHNAIQVNVDQFEGRAPFPEHIKWAPSWVNRTADKYGWLFSYPRLVKAIVIAESVVRRITSRWEPRCEYREIVNWRDGHGWPMPSGMTTFGPMS